MQKFAVEQEQMLNMLNIGLGAFLLYLFYKNVGNEMSGGKLYNVSERSKKILCLWAISILFCAFHLIFIVDPDPSKRPSFMSRKANAIFRNALFLWAFFVLLQSIWCRGGNGCKWPFLKNEQVDDTNHGISETTESIKEDVKQTMGTVAKNVGNLVKAAAHFKKTLTDDDEQCDKKRKEMDIVTDSKEKYVKRERDTNEEMQRRHEALQEKIKKRNPQRGGVYSTEKKPKCDDTLNTETAVNEFMNHGMDTLYGYKRYEFKKHNDNNKEWCVPFIENKVSGERKMNGDEKWKNCRKCIPDPNKAPKTGWGKDSQIGFGGIVAFFSLLFAWALFCRGHYREDEAESWPEKLYNPAEMMAWILLLFGFVINFLIPEEDKTDEVKTDEVKTTSILELFIKIINRERMKYNGFEMFIIIFILISFFIWMFIWFSTFPNNLLGMKILLVILLSSITMHSVALLVDFMGWRKTFKNGLINSLEYLFGKNDKNDKYEELSQ